VGGLDTGRSEELPNELATFSSVVVEGLVGPLARALLRSPMAAFGRLG
jgi:hypothetical protein